MTSMVGPEYMHIIMAGLVPSVPRYNIKGRLCLISFAYAQVCGPITFVLFA